jgi:hypothetical protein
MNVRYCERSEAIHSRRNKVEKGLLYRFAP